MTTKEGFGRHGRVMSSGMRTNTNSQKNRLQSAKALEHKVPAPRFGTRFYLQKVEEPFKKTGPYLGPYLKTPADLDR